ncbi:hypothetical protein FQN60_014983, partial [Etheostoma spectabile]
MTVKRRQDYTSPHCNHGLQKGSAWITGIFSLLLSKTELSAALTPFLQVYRDGRKKRWEGAGDERRHSTKIPGRTPNKGVVVRLHGMFLP